MVSSNTIYLYLVTSPEFFFRIKKIFFLLPSQKKKKMSKLSIDILSIIFEELEKENSTLYSCIFVNREWCQITIPFLWKNPWKRIDDYQNNGANKYKILFKCFLMMMPKESKEFLKV